MSAPAAVVSDPSAAVPAVASKPQRALALDALRGLAILGMCLSGVVPRGADFHLPSWMYHAQIAPPDFKFDSKLAGFTWVDLVFPAFLFAMGAAMPLALRGRLTKGAGNLQLLAGAFGRFVALAFFGLIVQHANPWYYLGGEGVSNWAVWSMTLGTFALLFAVYARWPESWPLAVREAIRVVGVVGCIAIMMMVVNWPGGSHAKVDEKTWATFIKAILFRSDIIIMVLASMAMLGTAVWLATRDHLPLRLGAMGLTLAFLAAYNVDGSWVRVAWDWPVRLFWTKVLPGPFGLEWVLNPIFVKYLFIVIPGTIAGDWLVQWRADAKATPDPVGGAPLMVGRLAAWIVAWVCLALVVYLHIGLHARWLISTSWVAIAVACGLVWATRGASTATGLLMSKCVAWGAFWLALGLLYEPFEGGIKKDNSTMSYYFVTVAMSLYLLAALTVWIDVQGWRQWWAWGWVIDNGQNPMIAYAGIRTVLPPLVSVTGAEALASRVLTHPWLFFLWSCAKTGVLAALTAVFTRARVFWRT